MPNFRDWTASEIVVQMPEARNILAKHFGPEGVKSGSSSTVRDLAKSKGVDVNAVVKDLTDMAKGTGSFT